MRLKIYNGKLITPTRIIPAGSILIDDGVIQEIGENNIEAADTMEINAQGNYVSPGFIDLHVHGGGGYDFMDGTELAFLRIAELHAKFGTTAIYPTTLTSSSEDLLELLDAYEAAYRSNLKGAQFLGMHLEGPYISMNQRGAQDPAYIRNPDREEYTRIIERYPFIRRWSAAPELEGALEFGRFCRSKQVLPAIAHTDAIYEEVEEAYKCGYNLITHFYSAMTGVTRKNCYRYAGVIESGYLIDDMRVEIIADGKHLPASLLKLIYKIKGPDKIALITDAMRNAGMPPGPTVLGSMKNGIKVIVEDGVAWLPDKSSFAGSVATADQLVANMISMAGVSLSDAVKMMTVTPATIMGMDDRKGKLVKGYDADIVIFDDEVKAKVTIVRGKIVYSN
jgi:N-acetylglucosamine-6-phosphate deacetylase